MLRSSLTARSRRRVQILCVLFNEQDVDFFIYVDLKRFEREKKLKNKLQSETQVIDLLLTLVQTWLCLEIQPPMPVNQFVGCCVTLCAPDDTMAALASTHCTMSPS